MFAPESLLSPGHFLLITDQLASPADFILHRCLNSWLRDGDNHRCLLFSEDLNRWKAIAAKSNMDLDGHVKSGSLVLVDPFAEIELPPANDSENNRLRSIFDTVSTFLPAPNAVGKTLVVIDDITSLLWLGFSELDIFRVCRAIRAVCHKSTAVLVIRHHVLSSAEPDNLFRHLRQLCTYHMEVLPLSSGRSGAVSGELAVHQGPSVKAGRIYSTTRGSRLQYRLTDGGSVFFEKGTSAGLS